MGRLLFWALSVVIAGFSYKYGMNIPFNEQWPLYESLRNTSAIIFGVMGAWIAILYPISLDSTRCDGQEGSITEKDIKKLIIPMLYSTLILSGVLIVGFMSPVLSQIDILIKYKSVIRGCSFSFLGILTFAQLWAILLSLMPNDFIYRMVRITREREKRKKRILPHLKRK